MSVVVTVVAVDRLLPVFGYKSQPFSWDWTINGYYELHQQRIYTLAKNAKAPNNPNENTDTNGFRYDPYDNNKIDKKNSIFMFGDSFVYGHLMNDDQTLPFHVQQYAVKNGKNVDIINAGIPGYGTDQIYIYIQEVMKTYNPSVIIWNVNPNDIGDSNDACLFKKNSNEKLEEIPIWMQSLYLEGYIVRKAPKFIQQSTIVNLIIKNLKHGHERFSIGCTLAYDRPDEILSRGLEKLGYLIEKIELIARQKGIRMIYTLLPAEFYFDPLLFSNSSDDLTRYFLLEKMLRGNNRTFIDMNELLARSQFSDVLAIRNPALAGFLAYSQLENDEHVLGVSQEKPTSLFIDGDGEVGYRHLNQKGNELLGKLISQELFFGSQVKIY